MANYYAKVFPVTVGGGPGALETVTLVVTADDGSNIETPVKAVANLSAYHAANDAAKALHDRFSDIVRFFSQYANPVKVASDGDQTITLAFEATDIMTNSTEGTPGFTNPVLRGNIYDLAAAYVDDNDHDVSAMTVKVDGVTISAT